MNKLRLLPLETDTLKIEVFDTPAGIGIRFEGDLDLRDPAPILEPFLDSFHKSVLRNSIKEIEADFCNLKYLNSAGIKELIKWLTKLRYLSKEDAYTIKFIYSPQITWQAVSLKTLVYLVPTLMTFKEKD